jgi:prepilin-type N-terminal cleavage/methylation domain-containing protein
VTAERAAGRRRGPRRRGQGGFTLIELMVALVVSSLLIGMILSIFTRMSMAYRAQQNIAELQQTLAAAQQIIQRDVRQAGYQLPDGFRWAGSAAASDTLPALQVINNRDAFGPDAIRVYYADASAQARVPSGGNSADPLALFTSVTVDDVDSFQAGDLAVLVTTKEDTVNRLARDATWYHHLACVVRVASVAGNTISFDTAAPWGTAANDQCDAARSQLGLLAGGGMLFRFTARAYRIDPARRSLAVLQLSPTGALIADDWQDLGVGFTDLQVATRWQDYWDPAAAAIDSDDLDTDPLSEWYSGEAQETLTGTIRAVAPAVEPTDAQLYLKPSPAEVRISLVVRTLKKVDAVPTAATPLLTDLDRVDNNDLGDRAPVALEGVADAARPAELRGEAVYRHATIGADLRNLAVGR